MDAKQDSPGTGRRRLASGRGWRWYPAFGRFALALTILAALVLNGSVEAPYEQAVHLVVALLVILFLPVRMRSGLGQRVFLIVGLALLAGSVWIVLQALPGVLPDTLTHPIWTEIAGAGVTEAASISVAPAQTLLAVPQFALAPLVFLTVLALCQGKRAATGMWFALSLVGSLVVALSILLELYFPERRFFSDFAVGFSAFSGVFVNRNVAASLFVMTAFALVGSIHMLRMDAQQRNRAQGMHGRSAWTFKSVLAVGALLAAVVSVIATQSRAGTFLGLPILVLCLAAIQVGAPLASEEALPPRAWRWTRAVLVVVVGFGLLTVFGEQVLLRFDTVGLADPRGCVFPETLRAIHDHPLTGTGFGSFEDVFPAYRDPTCGALDGTWVRAHNGYLELAIGVGIPAAVLLIGTGLAVVIGLCWYGLRQRRSLRPIPILTLGVLAFVAAHALVDFALQIPGIALYCAALLGAGCAICMIERREAYHPHRETRKLYRSSSVK